MERYYREQAIARKSMKEVEAGRCYTISFNGGEDRVNVEKDGKLLKGSYPKSNFSLLAEDDMYDYQIDTKGSVYYSDVPGDYEKVKVRCCRCGKRVEVFRGDVERMNKYICDRCAEFEW